MGKGSDYFGDFHLLTCNRAGSHQGEEMAHADMEDPYRNIRMDALRGRCVVLPACRSPD